MERRLFALSSKLAVSYERFFRQNVEVLLQIYELIFFLKRDIKEHQMRAIKVTKGSQAASQPPPYIKDSSKTQVSDLNSCGVCQEHHMLQQAEKVDLGTVI